MGAYPRETSRFRIRDFHPLWCSVPAASATYWFCNSPGGRQTPPDMSRYPRRAKAAAMAPAGFGLLPFRSPLLGESHSLSFPRATKRFYFARFGSRQRGGMLAYGLAGFPIRESTDHRLLAAPRGLSQLATPFIPSGCRGIHHRPLVAWPKLTSYIPCSLFYCQVATLCLLALPLSVKVPSSRHIS